MVCRREALDWSRREVAMALLVLAGGQIGWRGAAGLASPLRLVLDRGVSRSPESTINADEDNGRGTVAQCAARIEGLSRSAVDW